MSGLISVDEALRRILADVDHSDTETVRLDQAHGRVLARDVAATRTQPPFSASAMDGYAVRAADIATIPCQLTVIGESAAGHGYSGSVGPGEAVRIFTGAPVPPNADTIVIQENVIQRGSANIEVTEGATKGRYVRPAGLDFSKDSVLLRAATRIDPATLSLAAAINHPSLPVMRKPRVAVISSGDELVMPGGNPGPDQIIASNSLGVSAIVNEAGGEAKDLGIAQDTLEALAVKFDQAKSDSADIVITLGGASVGDHDLVHQALKQNNVVLNFWKLAMRPGKPVMFGIGETDGRPVRYIGLPGNPVSSLVCAIIFVAPLVRQMLGLVPRVETLPGVLAVNLPENDQREEYMRASMEVVDGVRHVTPFDSQDSSIITLMSQADCLMIRPAHAPPAKSGDTCEIIPL